MKVHVNPTLTPTALPGIEHATLAGSAEGLSGLSIWQQVIAPGAGTPPHRHACDEAVLCSGGEGEVHFPGHTLKFGANSTVCIPRDVTHQILNTGTEPLRLIAVFAQTPVEVFLPDGSPLALPWST